MVLWVLHECSDKVLSRDGTRLRASKEECEAFIDDPFIIISEKGLDEQDGEEITCLLQRIVLGYSFTTAINNALDQCAKC